jgi:5-oxoprolinase (ATP-hydrolysing)
VQRIQALKVDAQRQLVDQDVQADLIDFSVTVSMHYDGSDTVLQIPFGHNLETDFVSAHLRETSFSMGRGVKIANVRVYAVGKTMSVQTEDFAPALGEATRQEVVPIPSESTVDSYFEVNGSVTRYQTPVYTLSNVPIGSHIKGPAIIVDSTQTIVVEPHAKAICLNEHVILQIDNTRTSSVKTSNILTVDPIELAVFANRFMSIAEQMGHTLQRTSVSVSIKERLDFSCSIHGTDGALVANAPHIPVHLGSMQYAVQAQHTHWLGKLKPGDVLLTNHPRWGGTHLPDLTVITPVFQPSDETKVLFYVASRGHHTDM